MALLTPMKFHSSLLRLAVAAWAALSAPACLGQTFEPSRFVEMVPQIGKPPLLGVHPSPDEKSAFGIVQSPQGLELSLADGDKVLTPMSLPKGVEIRSLVWRQGEPWFLVWCEVGAGIKSVAIGTYSRKESTFRFYSAKTEDKCRFRRLLSADEAGLELEAAMPAEKKPPGKESLHGVGKVPIASLRAIDLAKELQNEGLKAGVGILERAR